MPSPTYQQNKKHIQKLNTNNPEKFRELCKRNQRKYDTWKRVQKIFFNILLEV